MKSVDIIFDIVEIPISQESINKIGKENGISMYIIKTYKQGSIWVDYIDESTGNKMTKIEPAEIYSCRTMKIDKNGDSYSAIIDGNPIEKYKKETIIKICKLNII